MIQFLNPLLLAGLAAVVVPVVLHLLSRSRFRSVDWGAMMFLPGGNSRRQQASRLRQWTLLALRCGLLVVLAGSLALPRVRVGRATGPELAMIILDQSASMGVVENERTRVDRAREAAMNVLAGLSSRDQAALIDADGDERPGAVTSDLQEIAQQIMAANAASGRANFAKALSRAAAISAQHRDLRPRIFIVSDRQANNWANVSAAFIARWKRDRSPPITWIPVGGKSEENVGIDSVQLLSPPAIAGLPAEIAVHVHNYGIAARGPIHLSLMNDGRALAATDLTLEPREDRNVVLTVHFVHSGQMRLIATIDTNDLASDNSRELVLEVVKRLPVLILTGEAPSGRFRREADFLQLALCPFIGSTTQPAGDGRNPCVVRIVNMEQWNPAMFEGQRVVILANTPALSTDQVRELEQFAYTGGGVIIAPGNQIHADDFNQSLYRNATGISPAALQPPTSVDAAPTSLLGIDLSHPIFQFLKGTPDPIPQATIARYFPASPHGGDVRVLASYATGEPFVVEETFGHGHVLLVTTPLNADWSNLPLSSFYLPFVQSCVKYLSASSMSRRDLSPGEMISGSFPGDVEPHSVRVTLPSHQSEECDLAPLGNRLEFRFGPVTQAGEYRVRALSPHGPDEQFFIVGPDSDESDLTPLGAEAAARLENNLDVQAPVKANAIENEGAEEISLWLPGIILAIAIGMGEMFLAGLWGRGPAK